MLLSNINFLNLIQLQNVFDLNIILFGCNKHQESQDMRSYEESMFLRIVFWIKFLIIPRVGTPHRLFLIKKNKRNSYLLTLY